MFIGAKVYPRPPKRKPWYGYLYIATFTERNKLKIGISADYAARDMQLRLKNETKDSAKIYYLWSLPFKAEIEANVKVLLFHFTKSGTVTKQGRQRFSLIFHCIHLYL